MKSLVVSLLICALTGGSIANQSPRHPRTFARSQVSRTHGPRKTYEKPKPEIRYVDRIKYVEKPVIKEVVKYVEKPVIKEVVKWYEKEVIKYVDLIRIKEPEKTPSTYCKRGEEKCRLGEGTVLKHCFHITLSAQAITPNFFQ